MITMDDILSKWEEKEYEFKAEIAMLRDRIRELEEENERLKSK